MNKIGIVLCIIFLSACGEGGEAGEKKPVPPVQNRIHSELTQMNGGGGKTREEAIEERVHEEEFASEGWGSMDENSGSGSGNDWGETQD